VRIVGVQGAVPYGGFRVFDPGPLGVGVGVGVEVGVGMGRG